MAVDAVLILIRLRKWFAPLRTLYQRSGKWHIQFFIPGKHLAYGDREIFTSPFGPSPSAKPHKKLSSTL